MNGLDQFIDDEMLAVNYRSITKIILHLLANGLVLSLVFIVKESSLLSTLVETQQLYTVIFIYISEVKV